MYKTLDAAARRGEEKRENKLHEQINSAAHSRNRLESCGLLCSVLCNDDDKLKVTRYWRCFHVVVSIFRRGKLCTLLTSKQSGCNTAQLVFLLHQLRRIDVCYRALFCGAIVGVCCSSTAAVCTVLQQLNSPVCHHHRTIDASAASVHLIFGGGRPVCGRRVFFYRTVYRLASKNWLIADGKQTDTLTHTHTRTYTHSNKRISLASLVQQQQQQQEEINDK